MARAAERLGAAIVEGHVVEGIEWGEVSSLSIFRACERDRVKILVEKILLPTNALSLALAGHVEGMHPRLTLAALTEPLSEEQLAAIGLGERKPFYTVDYPYLWGRVRKDNSVMWGAGLVNASDAKEIEGVRIDGEESSKMLATLERRVRALHPALADVRFTHHWGGPILFRDSWTPVFNWHDASGKLRNGIVLGAYAGHGVALSSYLGAWAAEALLGRRELPAWGSLTE